MREHWSKRQRRRAYQRKTTLMVCRTCWRHRPALPLAVRITRIAPRRLDPDNVPGATKAIVDGLCDWLEVDDGDERLTWVHDQQIGGRGEYGVLLELFEGSACEVAIVEATL
ncbi:MAG: hypothetical protein AAGA56_12275 [Myxococcota bacterium]